MKLLAAALELATAAASGLGLWLHHRDENGVVRRDMFVYYTNLSNLVIAVFALALFLTGFGPQRGLAVILRRPNVQLVLACDIWITHLGFAFLLAPALRRSGFRFPDAGRALSNLLVHYIAPLLALAQWALCAEKGADLSGAAWCLSGPLLYFIFLLFWARNGRCIDGTDSVWPYPFVDRDKLGKKAFVRNIVLTGLFVLALGCLMVLVGRFLPQ